MEKESATYQGARDPSIKGAVYGATPRFSSKHTPLSHFQTNQPQLTFNNHKVATGNRESLLSFVGADLLAVRWKQWRVYFTDVHPTGIGPQRMPGMIWASAPLVGYPKVYNIEMEPHEDLDVAVIFPWTWLPALEQVKLYLESVRKYPNPPAGNITQFGKQGG